MQMSIYLIYLNVKNWLKFAPRWFAIASMFVHRKQLKLFNNYFAGFSSEISLKSTALICHSHL